jgi:large subunit ribosomal protein L31
MSFCRTQAGLPFEGIIGHNECPRDFEMKQGIHPKTYPVLFVDGEHEWTGLSTTKSNQTRTIDGVEHSVLNVEISSYTHPFYTGQKKLVDTAGRVEKFMRRYGNQGSKGAAK